LQKELRLGNIDAQRDWTHAKDTARAIHTIVQQETPDDYVIASGKTRSIKELLDVAFGFVNLDWHDYVIIDPKFYRPLEVDLLLGNASKAKEKLGWEPQISFDSLVYSMIQYDLELASKESSK